MFQNFTKMLVSLAVLTPAERLSDIFFVFLSMLSQNTTLELRYGQNSEI